MGGTKGYELTGSKVNIFFSHFDTKSNAVVLLGGRGRLSDREWCGSQRGSSYGSRLRNEHSRSAASTAIEHNHGHAGRWGW
jgi:hypothetical protein